MNQSTSLKPIQSLPLPDEAATLALGAKLAAMVEAGDVLALFGDLGAGKTTLARGLITALSGSSMKATEVPSPTFTLVQTYEFETLVIYHFDLYRLEQPKDIWELGWEEALDEGVSLIEWPEHAGDLLPQDRLEITLRFDGLSRKVDLVGSPSWAKRLTG
jgi:tRNA threonylcarbamoyladenosine biosynthesis protein TsaE